MGRPSSHPGAAGGNPTPTVRYANTASSTSLKWGHDGELSPVDLQRVLERLTDPSLIQCALEGPAAEAGPQAGP